MSRRIPEHPPLRTRTKIELVVILAVAAVAIAGASGVFRAGPAPSALVSLVSNSRPLNDADAGHVRMACWPGNPQALTPLQESELLEAVLQRQADPTRPWHWLLANMLETRAGSGLLSSAQLTRYARAACPRPTFSSFPDAATCWMPDHATGTKREMFLFVHPPAGRGAPVSQLQQQLTLSAIRIGGHSVPDFVTTSFSPNGSGEPATPPALHAHGCGNMPTPIELDAGTYPMTCHVTRTVAWPGKPPLFTDEWDVTSEVTVGTPVSRQLPPAEPAPLKPRKIEP